MFLPHTVPPANRAAKTLTRPGVSPTHESVEGGKRWHYLDGFGNTIWPHAYLYEHSAGGWGGEAEHFIFPDGYSPPGPATREHIQERIEQVLLERGYTIKDA